MRRSCPCCSTPDPAPHLPDVLHAPCVHCAHPSPCAPPSLAARCIERIAADLRGYFCPDCGVTAAAAAATTAGRFSDSENDSGGDCRPEEGATTSEVTAHWRAVREVFDRLPAAQLAALSRASARRRTQCGGNLGLLAVPSAQRLCVAGVASRRALLGIVPAAVADAGTTELHEASKGTEDDWEGAWARGSSGAARMRLVGCWNLVSLTLMDCLGAQPPLFAALAAHGMGTLRSLSLVGSGGLDGDGGVLVLHCHVPCLGAGRLRELHLERCCWVSDVALQKYGRILRERAEETAARMSIASGDSTAMAVLTEDTWESSHERGAGGWETAVAVAMQSVFVIGCRNASPHCHTLLKSSLPLTQVRFAAT